MPQGTKRLRIRQSGTTTKYAFLPDLALPEMAQDLPVAIADMANAFGVTHRTLHFYEEKGMIGASRIGLMRVYGQTDVKLMALITLCREVGMPVAVIQDLLHELAGAMTREQAEGAFYGALAIRRRELMSGLSTIRRQIQQIGSIVDAANGDPAATNDNNGDQDLSVRERLYLERMADGMTHPSIARHLAITDEEAQMMERDVIRKFGAQNRFQAIAKAVMLGIVAS